MSDLGGRAMHLHNRSIVLLGQDFSHRATFCFISIVGNKILGDNYRINNEAMSGVFLDFSQSEKWSVFSTSSCAQCPDGGGAMGTGSAVQGERHAWPAERAWCRDPIGAGRMVPLVLFCMSVTAINGQP